MTTENLGRVVGFSILSGAGVPIGGLGDNGDSYLNTTNGDVYSKVGGAWSITGNIQGIQGEQGFSILSGAGAPTAQGVNGDTYLNTTNGDLYLKASGVWGSPTGSIRGPQGEQGIQGPIGISTTNMTTAGTILGLNEGDTVPSSPKQLSLVGASIVSNVFTINYQNAVTAYNAASGVDTPLTNAMSPLQMFQNLQKQSDNRFTKAESQQLVDDIDIGGRNLLRNSDVVHSGTDYPLTTYPITDSLEEDEECTITIWGEMGAGIDYIYLYNSGGSIEVTFIDRSYEISEGVFQRTFKWRVAGTDNNLLHVYPAPPGAGITTINKIKLERGNKGTDWTPAPEDVQAAIDDKVPATIGVAPASATATGIAGTVIFTTDYIYVCTATNTWKRTALTTW